MAITTKTQLIAYLESLKDNYEGTPAQFVNALCDFLENAVKVRVSTGDVRGTCPHGGGPLIAGAADNGRLEVS